MKRMDIIRRTWLLSVAILAVIGMKAQSQENYDYQPLVVEGRVWNIVQAELGDDGWVKSYYSYRIGEDTIILDMPCKKVYKEGEDSSFLYAYLYEQDRMVYRQVISFDQEWCKIYDFSMTNGDYVIYSGGSKSEYYLFDEDIKTVNNNDFRRMYFAYDSSYYGEYRSKWNCWVEGIGSLSGVLFPSFATAVGYYTCFLSCYQDGECIFEVDDFETTSAPNGIISPTPADVLHDGKITYDLQGCRAMTPQRPGIYIRDGKKVVVK